MATVKDVIKAMNCLAPERLAVEGDRIGLHAGSRSQKVSRVLVALEIDEKVLDEAAKLKADMIVTHHPLFYRPLSNLDTDRAKGAVAARIALAKLTIYCAHTNLDIAPQGVADCLADAAGLLKENRKIVEVTGHENFLKLAVFIPESHLERVRKAVCKAGAGAYDKYTDCTFRVLGTGAFKGGSEANPFIGKRGVLEEASEWRLETRVAENLKSQVEAALLKAHPYETPAYDFTRTCESLPYGLGRFGRLQKQTGLTAYARELSKKLKTPGAQYFGPASQKIKNIAVWSGSGLPAAKAARLGADCIVTGECGYHDLEEAEFHNLSVIRLGHGASENIIVKTLARNLQKALTKNKVEVKPSKTNFIRFRNV